MINMTLPSGFAVVGCTKCRRMSVADLTYHSKTCQCGHKIDLTRAKLLAVFPSADEAGEYLRNIQNYRNTGFTSAVNIVSDLKKE